MISELRYCIVRVAPDKSLVRLPSTFQTKTEAQDFLDSLQSNRRNGTEHIARCWRDEA